MDNVYGFTKDEEFIWKWQNDLLGGFQTALMLAICNADEDNLKKFELGFPEIIYAFKEYKHNNLWNKILQKIESSKYK